MFLILDGINHILFLKCYQQFIKFLFKYHFLTNHKLKFNLDHVILQKISNDVIYYLNLKFLLHYKQNINLFLILNLYVIIIDRMGKYRQILYYVFLYIFLFQNFLNSYIIIFLFYLIYVF